eukprot:SAG22_NODE_2504_length_2504_cov_1.404990_3_plen_52_part_00
MPPDMPSPVATVAAQLIRLALVVVQLQLVARALHFPAYPLTAPGVEPYDFG